MIGRRYRFHDAVRLLLAVVFVACLLGGCASATKVDDAPAGDDTLERYNRSARQAFDQGSFEQAAALYRKALDRATMRDDFEAIADARYNLAICLINQGALEEALAVIREAKTEMALRDRPVQLDFLLLEATVRFSLNQTGKALAITDEILAAESEASALIRSKALYLRGSIAARQGNLEELRESIASLGQPERAQLKADRYELQGHLAAAEKRLKAAADAFDSAAEFRREDLDYGKMTNALALAARACEQAGELREASKRYLRAGISAALQGDQRKAGNWLEQAEKSALAAGDQLAAARARFHLEKLTPH